MRNLATGARHLEGGQAGEFVGCAYGSNIDELTIGWPEIAAFPRQAGKDRRRRRVAAARTAGFSRKRREGQQGVSLPRGER